jgi:hypothetical protein
VGLIAKIVADAELPNVRVLVHTTVKTHRTLPGYFRPCKEWDVVVLTDDQLVAVVEVKSQVGSLETISIIALRTHSEMQRISGQHINQEYLAPHQSLGLVISSCWKKSPKASDRRSELTWPLIMSMRSFKA